MLRTLDKRKSSKKPLDNARITLNDQADDESYKRYQHIQYRNLVIKSLLTFILGMLSYFFIQRLQPGNLQTP